MTDASEKAREGEPVIEIRGIVKKYGDRVVLREISTSIDPGQVVALVGPSGGGKSTMLRCLVGLEPFDAGQVRVADAVLKPGSLRDNAAALALLHMQAGMVFQQWHLFPHMTAIENVYEAPVHVRKEPVEKARARAKELLAKVGLAHRENALPRAMSGGEQQRCAIARALAMRPKILFMDEPTSALDPARVGDLIELLQQLKHEEKLTLVVVTHEMQFAARLADRVLVLFDGHVVEDGPPGDVLTRPQDPRTRSFLGFEAH
jgi:polar amino acid transport system ATP-binding protein